MMRPVTDMMGREILIPQQPRRIVSLVPSQTELLYDLELEEHVAGITKFCVHPESWFRTKPRVGGTKQVHTDKVAALQPDLIIANKEENVKEQIEALGNIAPVWVSDIHTLPDALRMIREVGRVCDRAEKAAVIAGEIEAGFKKLHHSSIKKITYGIWRKPWMWAGADTFISDILQRMGWENALSGITRYPEISLEALAAYQPELVLLSSEPYPFKEQHIAEIKAVLPAADVLLVDGEMFSWYGSRLLYAVPYLNSLILRTHEPF